MTVAVVKVIARGPQGPAGSSGSGDVALTDLTDVTGTPSAGEAPVYDGADFALTDVATQDELDAAVAALSTVYQPLDSDLTAIAALSTTSFGRAVLALADAAALRTAAGLGTAAVAATGDFDAAGAAAAAQAASQPLDSDLTAIAALTTTSFGRAFLALVDAAAGRTALGLGTLATQSGTFSGTSSGTNTGDQTLSDATISTTDIATNNVSTSKHGFAPKAPNDATKFLDGTGAYAVPPGGSPSGSAGGDLAGTYPNPTIGAAKVTIAKQSTPAQAYGRILRTGAYAETFDRRLASNSLTLTAQKIYASAIILPAGISIAHITLSTSNVALSGTINHQYVALCDSSYNRLAVSADGTNGAWGADAEKTFNVSYTTTAEGLYYIAVLIDSSGMNNLLMNPAARQGAYGGLPYPGLSADTSVTSIPTTLGSIVGISQSFWAWVS